MWSNSIEDLNNGKTYKFQIFENEVLLSYREVVKYWRANVEFRLFFNEIFVELPFKAGFWETISVTLKSYDQPFEFVVRDSRTLARVEANPQPFERFFKQKTDFENIVIFPNLGEDALLVVPCPVVELENYTHLLIFLRAAPLEQIHAFWQSVGFAVEQALSEDSLWLSTSGLGVYWLHVRLDSRPKYYGYLPYKN